MSNLNTPIPLKGMRLRNRLVLAPITTNYAKPDGSVTQDNVTFYDRRSKDIGLIIVEATGVQESGCLVPCSPGLWSDDHIPGMKTLVDIIHNNGAKAVVQLNHAGARCAPRDIEKQGFSPSGVRFRMEEMQAAGQNFPSRLSRGHWRWSARIFRFFSG